MGKLFFELTETEYHQIIEKQATLSHLSHALLGAFADGDGNVKANEKLTLTDQAKLNEALNIAFSVIQYEEAENRARAEAQAKNGATKTRHRTTTGKPDGNKA